ncbi:Crp/Fnr family transcriptional regulator [Paenibacillus chartarius]|uniref:Crp/Fnr family transcriptional regulator n=1 Tax=Paenibacillus chartarius TaxID=747481 RepID=A0ABV6DHD9_9BACL
MSPADINRVIRLFPFLSSLAPSDWREASLQRVHPGEKTKTRGDELNHAILVVAGSVRVFRISEATGREITLYRVRSGEVCILMMASILGQTVYGASAEVETECELLIVPRDTFENWAHRHEHISRYLFSQVTRRMAQMSQLIDQVTFMPIGYRLAEFLLLKGEADGSLAMTHDRLAVELGTSREVVSRGLKEMERAGLLKLGRGKIEHIDLGALDRIRRGYQ